MTTHAAAAHVSVAHRDEEEMSRGMAGMVLFIASEIMLFAGCRPRGRRAAARAEPKMVRANPQKA